MSILCINGVVSEFDRKSYDLKILEAIVSALVEGEKFVEKKEMDRLDILDLAIGKADKIYNSALWSRVRQIFAPDQIKGKTLKSLATEVKALFLNV